MSVPHTPGPWDYGARLSASENHHGFYVRADGWALAFVQPGDQDGVLGEANARLIAAAPEQHSALLAVLYAPAFNALDDATKNTVRSAIAKAEGKS